MYAIRSYYGGPGGRGSDPDRHRLGGIDLSGFAGSWETTDRVVVDPQTIIGLAARVDRGAGAQLWIEKPRAGMRKLSRDARRASTGSPPDCATQLFFCAAAAAASYNFV